MKSFTLSTALAVAFGLQDALAFPAAMLEQALADPQAAKLAKRVGAPQGGAPDAGAALFGFNAEKQYVSNKGEHAFVAPDFDAGDQRGPCPGLNAMANHNYLPHNGIATITEFISGTYEVFGMGADLSAFLAIYGSVFDGDLTSWSIGGPVPQLLNLGLLGEPQGIAGSHNNYEGDVSPTRGDLYEYGNDFEVVMSQFKAMYELGMAEDNYDMELLREYRYTRFQQSVANNPYFFNGIFSGIIASPAAWSFVYRFMGNKSEEYPQGQLNGEVLKTFYSITGDYPNFKYTPGYEKIPDNWYTRARGDEYSIPFYLLDNVYQGLAHPEFFSLGGNTGKVNTFTGIDLANVTDGVFNAATLTEGNNAACLALQLTLMEAPDFLTALYEDVASAVNALDDEFTKTIGSLGCPKLSNVDMRQFKQFPGYTQLKSDGTY